MTKKRIARLALEAALLIAAAVLGAWLYWLRCVETVNTTIVPARIDLYEVKEGMTATAVSEDLMGDVVPSFALRLWVRRHPELQSIQRGHYRIDGKLTLKEILSLMVMGKITETAFPTIAIIEGSTITDVERTMKRFCGSCEQALAELDVPAEFIITSLHSDPELIGAIGGAASSLEGLLAPATYQVKSPRRINEALAQALRSTARLMKEEWPRRSDAAYVKTPYEALIVASIIERETAIADERPQVAAVFYNRMRKRMRLQTDPTVMYGVSPDFSGKLTKAQLRQDTPYNTYTRQGLPPTPISMPSKSSILAALHPSDTDALYFVAADIDPSNGHVFTNTLKDHNKAVSDYRKKVSDYLKQQKDAQDAAKDDGTATQDQGQAAAKGASDDARKAAPKDQPKDQQKPQAKDQQKDQQDQQKDQQKARQDQQKASQDQAGSQGGAKAGGAASKDGGSAAASSDQDGAAGVDSKDGEVDLDITGSAPAKDGGKASGGSKEKAAPSKEGGSAKTAKSSKIAPKPAAAKGSGGSAKGSGAGNKQHKKPRQGARPKKAA
ncbi:MAG: endolytic transglycosylase MltG [Succinivibrio sp.]